MRLVIKFEPEKGCLKLPINYNHILQGAILRSLKKGLADWVHDNGYEFNGRKFKLYTFSRLFSREKKVDKKAKTITFCGQVLFKVSSVDIEILESLASYLVKEGAIVLNGTRCIFNSIEVERPILPNGEPILIKALSPITVYRTLYTTDGRKKTYYFTPFEKEFEELIFDNLRRKAKAYYGDKEIPDIDGYIRPYRVEKKNLIVTTFKGTVIKAWFGIYEIKMQEPWFMLAYNAGLGSKNSQGFGMIDVVRKRLRRDKEYEGKNHSEKEYQERENE